MSHFLIARYSDSADATFRLLNIATALSLYRADPYHGYLPDDDTLAQQG